MTTAKPHEFPNSHCSVIIIPISQNFAVNHEVTDEDTKITAGLLVYRFLLYFIIYSAANQPLRRYARSHPSVINSNNSTLTGRPFQVSRMTSHPMVCAAVKI